MMTVWPNSSTDRRRRSSSSPEDFESRLPVGSSANTTAGLEASARATATRCCGPPESSDGRWSRRSRSPTVSISFSSHSASGRLPAIDSGSTMFSRASRTGRRLNDWNTNPTRSRRSSVSLRSSSFVISTPSSTTEPDVGRSSPARMCISVDLPEPDGPMMAVKRLCGKPTVTPSSARTAASPSPKTRVMSAAETRRGPGRFIGTETRATAVRLGTDSRTSGLQRASERGRFTSPLRSLAHVAAAVAHRPALDRRRPRAVAPARRLSQHRQLRPAAALRVGDDAGGARGLARRAGELGALGRLHRGRARRGRDARRHRGRVGGHRRDGLRAHRARRRLAARRRPRPGARRRLRLGPVPVPRARAPRRLGAPRAPGRARRRDRRRHRPRRVQRGADDERRGAGPRRDRGRGAGARGGDARRRHAGVRLAADRRSTLRRRRLPRLQVAHVAARHGVHGRRRRPPRRRRPARGGLVGGRRPAQLLLRRAAAARVDRAAARHVAGVVLLGGHAARARARQPHRRRGDPRPRRGPGQPLPRRSGPRAGRLGDRVGRCAGRARAARGGGHRRRRARRAAAHVVAPLQHRGRRRRGARRARGGLTMASVARSAYAPFREEGRALLPEGTAVLDAHTHLGVDEDGQTLALDELIGALDDISPDARAVTFPLHDPDRHPGYQRPNDRVLEWAAQSGGRVIPYCRLDPSEDPVGEARRCLERGARGIKLHPRAQAFQFGHEAADGIFAVAREAGVPILVHAGRGMAPMDALAELALEYPDVPLVLAHAGIAGQGMFASRLADHPGALYDTSCLSPFDVIELFARVPAERIVYASDVPYGRPAFALYQALRIGRLVAGLDDEALRLLFGGTMAAVLDGAPLAPATAPRVPEVRAMSGRLLRAATYLHMGFSAIVSADGARDPSRALPWVA